MKWAIDPMHSSVTFTIRHMLSRVRGSMLVKEGWIEAENDHSTARVQVTLDAASIDTGVEYRDNHLRSADGHFDVENHPTVTFTSKRVEGKDPASFKLIGDLTIRGITKEITLDASFGGEAKDAYGKRRVGFSANTRVNRKDFGLTWNQVLEGGKFMLGDDVSIEIDVQATPAETQAEAGAAIQGEARAEARV